MVSLAPVLCEILPESAARYRDLWSKRKAGGRWLSLVGMTNAGTKKSHAHLANCSFQSTVNFAIICYHFQIPSSHHVNEAPFQGSIEIWKLQWENA